MKNTLYEVLEQAIVIGLRAVDAAKKKYGETHRYYATSLNNLGSAYEKAGEYKKAKLLHIQVLEEMRAKYKPYFWAAFVLVE